MGRHLFRDIVAAALKDQVKCRTAFCELGHLNSTPHQLHQNDRPPCFVGPPSSQAQPPTAIAFAQHGVTKLALADINQDALDVSAGSLKKQFPHVHILPVHLNVRDSTQVKEGIAKTIGEFGRLDIAVNNVGISGSGRKTHELEDDEWLGILDVNLQGVYRCQKEELDVMVNQEAKSSHGDLGHRVGRGRIINVGSMFAVVAPNNQDHTAYATAKHGIIGLTKADANSYGPLGIRINAICPGYVETPLLTSIISRDPDSPLAVDLTRTSLKRMATMKEVADAIVQLASPMNSYMQGASMICDGGFTSN
ncbi:dehydrogenase [Fusarium agapanthi]|uniref:Dehydrogenase n=1 Tax=Fusarium agapanthi TaxID=1803897 RepID=A0A9P5B5P3_9HYPO|nr:dehydrogenase [Fusarium agapanthi]